MHVPPLSPPRTAVLRNLIVSLGVMSYLGRNKAGFTLDDEPGTAVSTILRTCTIIQGVRPTESRGLLKVLDVDRGKPSHSWSNSLAHNTTQLYRKKNEWCSACARWHHTSSTFSQCPRGLHVASIRRLHTACVGQQQPQLHPSHALHMSQPPIPHHTLACPIHNTPQTTEHWCA